MERGFHPHVTIDISIFSGLCLLGASDRRSRDTVVGGQILKGSMGGRTRRGVQGCSTSMDRW